MRPRYEVSRGLPFKYAASSLYESMGCDPVAVDSHAPRYQHLFAIEPLKNDALELPSCSSLFFVTQVNFAEYDEDPDVRRVNSTRMKKLVINLDTLRRCVGVQVKFVDVCDEK